MILLTGASGFLGQSILEVGLQQNLSFRSLARRPCDSAIDHVSLDLSQSDVPKSAFVGIETVIHAAGLAHQFGSQTNSRANFISVNVDGTRRLVSAAVDSRVNHIVLISSMSVYGPGSEAAWSESDPCNPVGHYGESKFLAEQIARETVKDTPTKLTILRMSTLYGDGDRGNVNRLIEAIDRGRFFLIGDGQNQKNLLYRTDAATACLAAATQASVNPVAIFNVADRPVAMIDVVGGICRHLNRSLPLKVPSILVGGLRMFASMIGHHGPIGRAQNAVTKFTRSDIVDGSAFADQFGFAPRISLDQGLQLQIANYRHTKSPQRHG